MQKTKIKDKITLPKALSKDWLIKQIIFFNQTHTVCLLTDYREEKSCILKIFSSGTLSRRKLHRLSHISDKYLLLPQKHIHTSDADYILYPRQESLKELIFHTGMSFQEILSLGIHLTYAVEELSRAGCYEADISPCNIYHQSTGFFCLGDLCIEKRKQLGTPPYLAPETQTVNRKKPLLKKEKKKRFEQEAQYSICLLLESLCKLQESFYFQEIQQVLQIGTQEVPEKRYHSLQELRSILKDILKKYSQQPYQLLVLHEENHPVFTVKTLPLEKEALLSPILLIRCLTALAALLLIFSLKNMPMSKTTSKENPDLIGSSIPSENPAPVENPTPTESAVSTPAAISESEKTELDIQKKGLYSFSTVIKMSESPSDILCLYAGGNLFCNLQSISKFPQLKELYVDDNRLNDISELSKCSNLEILVLSYNDIQSVSAITKLTKLRHLDLSSNQNFDNIKSLQKMKTLDTLNISNTNISVKQYRQLCKKLPDCLIIY